jgi:hypothetical protein
VEPESEEPRPVIDLEEGNALFVNIIKQGDNASIYKSYRKDQEMPEGEAVGP